MRRREHGDRGAAAVEFALVVPILVVLVLGLVDYGIYFTDSLGVRQGLREGARQGIVENFPTGACSGDIAGTGDNADLNELACSTLDGMSVIGGTAFLRIESDSSWDEGEDLVLCAALDEDALTGYTPLPDDGNLRAVFRMRIEQADTAPVGTGEAHTGATSGGPTQPAGGWTWCT